MAKGSQASKAIDPFKTKKSKAPAAAVNDEVSPPEEIARAIDSFREAQEQYKHYEGEMTIYKDQVISYANHEYAQRLLNGMKGSFKILGEQTMVTYVVMDSSAGLTEEDVADFSAKWGEGAANELIGRDFASIRFDPAVLEANYAAVVQALQVLPEQVLRNLFKPMLMKAKAGAADIAKAYAKSPEEMQEILGQLKMKNYIR